MRLGPEIVVQTWYVNMMYLMRMKIRSTGKEERKKIPGREREREESKYKVVCKVFE